MSTFTNRDKAECAKREVGKRRRVYPRLVADRGMDQAKADREIALMAAIQWDYEQKAHEDERGARLL